jgi:hypothetical protein
MGDGVYKKKKNVLNDNPVKPENYQAMVSRHKSNITLHSPIFSENGFCRYTFCTFLRRGFNKLLVGHEPSFFFK